MRVATLSLFCACSFMFATSVAPAGDRAGWSTDFESAQASARQQKRTLVLHFHARWCGPCRRMESGVLNSREVMAALQSGVVAVKIDADRRPDLIRRYGISSLPADVFVSWAGEEQGRQSGYSGKRSYVAALDRYRSPASDPTPAAEASTDVRLAEQTSEANDLRVGTVQSGSRVQTASAKLPTNSARPTLATTSVAVRPAARPAAASTTAGERMPEDSAGKATGGLFNEAVRPWRKKRLGLSGYCPVSLAQSLSWKAGEATFEHEVDGVCYRLHDGEVLQQFAAHPERFVPALHGYDAVAMKDGRTLTSGVIELGARYRGRLFFFSSAANRNRFLTNPNPYADLALGTPDLLSTAVGPASGF